MTPERREELRRTYRRAIKNLNQEETAHHWFRYLAALWKEDNDLQIFLELRDRPRIHGAELDDDYLRGKITRRQLIAGLRKRCAERYARPLNRYGVAEIDVDSRRFKRRVIRKLGPEVIRAFDGVDPDDSHAFCRAMAITWNRLVNLIHAEYDLPTVKEMRKLLPNGSDAEAEVLDDDDFETHLTPQERADLEAELEDEIS